MTVTNTEKVICKCLTCGNMREMRIILRHSRNDENEIQCKCYICHKKTSSIIVTSPKEIDAVRKSRVYSRQRRVKRACDKYHFKFHFGEQHAFIKTELGAWFFDYLDPLVTLYHESTRKINRRTGEYSAFHVQFENKYMSIEKVIDYIASHDDYRMNEMERNANDNIMIAYSCGGCGFTHAFTERGEIIDKRLKRNIRREVLAGNIGRSARRFLKTHNPVEFSVRSVIYQCSRCGDLQGMQCFRMAAGKDHFTKLQPCEKCDAYTMRMIPYKRIKNAACPVCGSAEQIECRILNNY